MLSLLSNIVSTISAFVTFVFNSLFSLINLLIKIPTYITFIITSINLLPAVIIPFAIAAVYVTYTLFILNR